LIALQGSGEDPAERRKRQARTHRARRARRAQDRSIGGTLFRQYVDQAAGGRRPDQARLGQPQLDQVLGEIELRLEVEIAKMAR